MTQDEMQRFLDLEAMRGTDELDAYRNLAKIIGITYPRQKAEGKSEKTAGE